MSGNRVLFVKPPDRFLEKEFVYPQLGPNYLQSYLQANGIGSDMLILHELSEVRTARQEGNRDQRLEDLSCLLVTEDGTQEFPWNPDVFGDYEIVGMSVMSPQAPDAYLLSGFLNAQFPHITTVIGGSHPRYYKDSVVALDEKIAFDFIVPQDGWEPMLQIAKGEAIVMNDFSNVVSEKADNLRSYPAPTRPLSLMERYIFDIGGVPSSSTITALGCPFTCNFCESGRENVRMFGKDMIDEDLRIMAEAHKALGREQYGVMFFDDVGLIRPGPTQKLAEKVSKHGYRVWRAFSHASYIVSQGDDLLAPFRETGGLRVGIGLETGCQETLDRINKNRGKGQKVEDHLEAVQISNGLGVAIDAFTMLYPWQDEASLQKTVDMVEAIMKIKVNGKDPKGRPLLNHVDSTIMSPYQGTDFYDMIESGNMEGVELIPDLDPGLLFYKGEGGSSGFPYSKSRLPYEAYKAVQDHINGLRPDYR